MTIISPNSISGITSITAQSGTLEFYDAAGSTLNVTGDITGNVTGNLTGNINSTGVSTITTLNATSIVGVVTAGITTAYVGSINNGPLAGFRNAIINGNFDIWQRGTSFTGIEYTADRWRLSRNVSSATVSRQAFSLGQTDVPDEPTYFIRTVVTSSSNAAARVDLQHWIEGVRTFAGKQVTLSFWAKADASKPIAIEYVQIMGSGGSPSTSVNAIGVTKVTLGTSWQKFTITTNIPSISGKTLGSDNNDALVILFWFDAGSDFNSRSDSLGQQSGTFDIAQVQLEAGPVSSPFERRPIGTELALCQRYYQILGSSSLDSVGTTSYAAGAGANMYTTLPFVTEMRSTPTVTISTFALANTNQPTVLGVSANSLTWSITSLGAGRLAARSDTQTRPIILTAELS